MQEFQEHLRRLSLRRISHIHSVGAEILTLNKSTACFQNTVQNVYLIAADFKRIGMTIQFKIVQDVFLHALQQGVSISLTSAATF